ncbi:MAG TPA: CBS domain-containing protein [Polyangiaceae bacterium]|jgi:CBS domain-containing protein
MKMLVCDYMNRDLVYLREGDRLDIARKPMLDFGVTAVPILDDEHRPVGVVTLRDLAAGLTEPPRSIVKTIQAGATLDEAARALAHENIHHLIVIGGSGEAIGMLSSLDVVRGLLGLPARHPAATTRFASARPE